MSALALRRGRWRRRRRLAARRRRPRDPALAATCAVGARGRWPPLAAVGAIVAANPAERFREFKAPPARASPVPVGAGQRPQLERPLAVLERGGRRLRERARRRASAPEATRTGGPDTRRSRCSSAIPHSLPLQQAAELGLGRDPACCSGSRARSRSPRARRLAAGLDGDAGVLVAVLVGRCRRRGDRLDLGDPGRLRSRGGRRRPADGLGASARRLGGNAYWLGVGTRRGRLDRDDRRAAGRPHRAGAEAERDAPPQRQIAEGIERAHEAAQRCSPGRPSPTPSSRCSTRQRGRPRRRAWHI